MKPLNISTSSVTGRTLEIYDGSITTTDPVSAIINNPNKIEK